MGSNTVRILKRRRPVTAEKWPIRGRCWEQTGRKKRLDDDVVRALIAVISSPASLPAAPSELENSTDDLTDDRRRTTDDD
jgi:hypothetical protein